MVCSWRGGDLFEMQRDQCHGIQSIANAEVVSFCFSRDSDLMCLQCACINIYVMHKPAAKFKRNAAFSALINLLRLRFVHVFHASSQTPRLEVGVLAW